MVEAIILFVLVVSALDCVLIYRCVSVFVVPSDVGVSARFSRFVSHCKQGFQGHF